jgi:hypothetical protein
VVLSYALMESRNIYQPLANCIHNEIGGLMNTECRHYIRAVRPHCILAETELGCNFFARLAIDDQFQDFELALGELAVAPASWRGLLRWFAREVWSRISREINFRPISSLTWCRVF